MYSDVIEVMNRPKEVTPEEAIKFFKDETTCRNLIRGGCEGRECDTCEYEGDFKNRQQYELLAITAIEKQALKKPTDFTIVGQTIGGSCLVCGMFCTNTGQYCKHCGQKLDWRE